MLMIQQATIQSDDTGASVAIPCLGSGENQGHYRLVHNGDAATIMVHIPGQRAARLDRLTGAVATAGKKGGTWVIEGTSETLVEHFGPGEESRIKFVVDGVDECPTCR